MSEDKALEDKYQQATRIIVKAGAFPFPITNTLVEITKLLVNENELDFILAFKRKVSQTMEELKKSSKMTEEEILERVEALAKKGLIFNQPSSKGIMIYRLMSLMLVGVFEYSFMRKLQNTEYEKKLAILFKKTVEELRDFIQNQYDTIVPYLNTLPPVDRTIPILSTTAKGDQVEIIIDQAIEVSKEEVLLTKNIEDLIDKFDDIAVAHCYCRQYKESLGEQCKIGAPIENCFTFGKSARHVANQGFGRLITKEEALDILKETEEHGLVHKAIHLNSDIYKDETSLCNCCPCCCETINLWKSGVYAMVNATNYLSIIDKDLCVGCGTCVEKCIVGAIRVNDDNKAERDENLCIGCGVCAHICPEAAISMLKGKRTICVPPPRLK